MDITDYLKALAARWWVIAATLLIGLGGGFIAYTSVDPTYSASSQLFVTATGTGSVADAYQGTVLSSQRAAAYTSLVSGQQVLSRTAAQLGPESPQDLASSVVATNTLQSPVISIAVVADNAQTAQDLANAVAANAIAYIAEVDAPQEGRPAVVTVEQTEIASLPSGPIAPDLIRFLLLGAGGGLVVGIAVAMLWTRLSNKVTEKSTAANLLDVPVLGEIPKDRDLKKDAIAEFTIGQSKAAEAFRKLRTSLGHVDFENPPRAVLFTSAKAGDGKTTVVLNLAQALAEAGESVIAIEADLRRPSFAKYIDLRSDIGLGDVLDGTVAVEDAIQYPGDAGVAVISVGALTPNPSELLGSSAMAEVITTLRGMFTYVLVDSPPALPVTDASVVSPLMDGVIIVAALRTSNASNLENVTKLLRTVHAHVLGSVLTFTKTSTVLESSYYAAEVPKKRTNANRRPPQPKQNGRHSSPNDPIITPRRSTPPQSEPARSEPARSEPARSESARSEPEQSEPAPLRPARPVPARTPADRSEKGRSESETDGEHDGAAQSDEHRSDVY